MPSAPDGKFDTIIEKIDNSSEKMYRLRVVQEPQETFYKDEGGKANHLVTAVTVDGPSLQGKYIVLSPTLCYENGREVEDAPDIFKVVSMEPPQIHASNETTLVKFRIEKVSRRKDGQRFKVRFDIDQESSTVDSNSIGITSTVPVCVLSKRKFVSSNVGKMTPPAKRIAGNDMKRMKASPTKYMNSGNLRRGTINEEPLSNNVLLSLHKTIARLESRVSSLSERVNTLENELATSREEAKRELLDNQTTSFSEKEFPLFNRVRGDSEETEFLYDFVGPFDQSENLKRSNSINDICMNFGLPSSVPE